jgi:nucleoside-diphosphate-sugar epimerase
VIVVNPAEVYGPNDTSLVTAGNIIDFAKSSPVLVCRGGTGVVHVGDVAAAIVACLQNARLACQLATGN